MKEREIISPGTYTEIVSALKKCIGQRVLVLDAKGWAELDGKSKAEVMATTALIVLGDIKDEL